MPPTPFEPAFDRLVSDALNWWHIPGVSFAVVSGERMWTKAYGFVDLESRAEIWNTTLFYATDTTKAQLCAVWAIYISSQENENSSSPVGWDTPLVDLIREDFVLSDLVLTQSITLEDALSIEVYVQFAKLLHQAEQRTQHLY